MKRIEWLENEYGGWEKTDYDTWRNLSVRKNTGLSMAGKFFYRRFEKEIPMETVLALRQIVFSVQPPYAPALNGR